MRIRLKRLRYGKFDRVRRRKDLKRYLAAEAARLLSSVSTQNMTIIETEEAVAEGVLTLGANAANTKVVTIGSKTYTFKTALTEGTASGDLVTDTTNAANGSTVVIGAVAYTFQDTLTAGSAGEVHVLIGGDAEASLLNLARAINNSGGTPATDYDTTGTGAHPLVASSATVSGGTTITLTGLEPGVAANVATTASTSPDSHIDPEGVALTGGVDPIANEIAVAGSASLAIDSLIAAINGDAGEGTLYSTGTVAHTQVEAAVGDGDTMGVSALVAGEAGNHINTSTDIGTSSFGAATLTGGIDEAFGPNVTVTTHGHVTGDGPFVLGGTRPVGVGATVLFWTTRVDANTLKLSRSMEDLQKGVYESFADAGTSVVLKRPSTSEGIYEFLRRNDARTISAAADIDNLV